MENGAKYFSHCMPYIIFGEYPNFNWMFPIWGHFNFGYNFIAAETQFLSPEFDGIPFEIKSKQFYIQ